MKTLKIPENVHTELKVYVATQKEDMSDVAGYAIMKYLSDSGHKFVVKPIKSKKKA